MRLPRSLTVGMAATVLCGSLTGCTSLKELTASSKPLPGVSSPTVSPSPTPSASTATAETVKLPTRSSGPLDTGTVTHRVKQGTFSIQLTYWTADNAKLYTASSLKTINVAAHVEDSDGSHRMIINTVEVTQDDGTNRAVVTTDDGKFDITPPYPYNTVITPQAASAGAKALTLTVRMDLLVETAPKANRFYRSTAIDTLTLPLLTNGAS
ncbi:hypothetical protein [Actinoplanes solisilvae]|uniref:hypothetical protein n=1 Tax=Actinoplanes solisilvae TaxID=2486853 RepID=UPI001F0BEA37|nr:hypothetical protein [Actinoplanes solisilvae]